MVARGGFSIWCCRISRLVTRERRVQRNHRRLPKCPTPPYLTGTANGTRRCINGSPHDRARPSETTRLVDAHRYRPSCRWSKCTLKRARDHSGVFVDSIGFEPYEMRRLRRSESPVGSWRRNPATGPVAPTGPVEVPHRCADAEPGNNTISDPTLFRSASR